MDEQQILLAFEALAEEVGSELRQWCLDTDPIYDACETLRQTRFETSKTFMDVQVVIKFDDYSNRMARGTVTIKTVKPMFFCPEATKPYGSASIQWDDSIVRQRAEYELIAVEDDADNDGMGRPSDLIMETAGEAFASGLRLLALNPEFLKLSEHGAIDAAILPGKSASRSMRL